jgi:peptidoglycan-associated lipoprotein
MLRIGFCILAFWSCLLGTGWSQESENIKKPTPPKTKESKASEAKPSRTPGFIQKLADESDTLGSNKVIINEDKLEGNRAYKAENYFFAIEHYKKALRVDKKDTQLPFLIAECYRLANEIKNADIWYARAIKAGVSNDSIHIHYGTILRALERYPEAIEQYQAYLRYVPQNAYTKWLIESCKLAQTWLDKPARYTVENLQRFNTKNSEFGITPMKYNAVLLSSTRPDAMGVKLYGRLGEDFSDLFESYVDGQNKWTKLRPVPGMVNTLGNDATPCLTAEGNTLYFTRCSPKNGSCRIFKTTRTNAGWAEPVLVPIMSDTVDVGHPAVTTNEDKMYFVASNAEGGYGGKDIWFMNRSEDDTWEEPVNLGPTVNTERDEMFPYIHASDTVLFFASDGHPGMGGLDVFRSVGGGSDWEQAENMRNPINSGADDFGITVNEKITSGFLASSRVGGRGSDDIYVWNFIPYRVTLSGKVYDDTTGKVIPKAQLRLVLEDSSYFETNSDSLGQYYFKIREDVHYRLEASVAKENIPYQWHAAPKQRLLYYQTDSTFHTFQTKDDTDWNIDLPMRLVPTEEIRLSDIMYDYDKSSLRPESVMALDSLINFLNKSPNVSIAIHSHTDSRGSDSYNLALSQRRAQSVVDYLISKGISSQRLIAQGHGESRLINRCKDKAECDEAEHQLNRRTAFSITAIDLDRVIVKYKRVTGEETEDAEEAVYKAISDKRKSRRPARQASR